MFEVEGLSPAEFSAEAQLINHIAFTPNCLDRSLVHRFKSIMQQGGMQQSSAGINKKESGIHGGKQIQGVTLIYYNQSMSAAHKARLEVCMPGMHPELLENA